MSNVRFLPLFIPEAPEVPKALIGGAAIITDAQADMGRFKRLGSIIEIITSQQANISVRRPLNGGTFSVSVKGANASLQLNRPAPVQSPDCTFFFPYNRWTRNGHAVITASTEVPTFPTTNTQKQQRSKIWRSTSKSSQYLQGDLGNPYRINSVAVVSHNLSSTGTYRVRVGNSASMATTLYDSGTQRIWEPSFATTGFTSDFADPSGYPTDETIAFLRYCSERPRTVRWVIFPEVAARYVRIDFNDPDNEDDYIEVAYVYAGLCIRVSPDQLYGWQIYPVGISRVDRAADGGFWIDNLYRFNRASASYGAQPEVNTLAFWNFMGSYLGKTREFIVAFQPDNLPRKFWYSMYCRLVEIPQAENQAFRRQRVQFEVMELP
jgi:hypothetical protein